MTEVAYACETFVSTYNITLYQTPDHNPYLSFSYPQNLTYFPLKVE
jgi:hypothetical protein